MFTGKVTNKIIADLERGNLTWMHPWQSGMVPDISPGHSVPEARHTVASTF